MKWICRWGDFIQQLIFGKLLLSFEDKLLLSSTLLWNIFCFLSIFENLYLGFDISIVILTVAGFFVSLGFYLYFRFVKRTKAMFFVMAIILLLFLDIDWFFNYGSNGPVFLFFIVLYVFIVLVFYRKYYLYFSIILVFNVSVLFVVEYFAPEKIGDYPDYTSKLIDNYLGVVISILLVFFFLNTIKRKYLEEYERAKRSDQLKSAFLANLSHEIRTPLNSIVGFASLLDDETIDKSEKTEFVGHIQHNSENLLNLITDIIDVSKIESNSLELFVQMIDVVPVINSVFNEYQVEYQLFSNITVVNSISDLSLFLRVDIAKFEQIIRHLLSNAFKFTEARVIEIGITHAKDTVVIWVKDEGSGIHPDHAGDVFKRFIKLESTHKHLRRGTGIGLYLCKELMKKMNGKIWFESVPGKGSTFYIELPRAI